MRPHRESKKRRNRDRGRQYAKVWGKPMRWQPLTVAQLRYDKISKGWAAALKEMERPFWEGVENDLMEAVPFANEGNKVSL